MEGIQGMKELFIRAYSGTSFSPEKRAESAMADFEQELEEDLGQLNTPANHEEKYKSWLRVWLGRKSRCMSMMITGPANFPVERNMKNQRAEQRAWEDFRKWRERYIRSVNRVRTKSPEEEIDEALAMLDKARENHLMMVEINKILRKKKSKEEKRSEIYERFMLGESFLNEIILGSGEEKGFECFVLTNSNARIKRLEEKLLVMRNRIARRDSFEPINFTGGQIDIENDRVVIRHNEKPSSEIIQKLKEKGFRWSPKGQFWCRKHTVNAIYAAKFVCVVMS